MSHHRIALLVIAAAAVLDAGAGWWFAVAERIPVTSGLCYSLGVATTSGSSVPVVNGTGRLVTCLIQVTIIPLFAATFSLFTSALSAIHIRGIHDRLDDMTGAK